MTCKNFLYQLYLKKISKPTPMYIQKLLSLLICFLFGVTQAQVSTTQQQAIILKRMIELHHYRPRPVDDSLSSEIFLKFVDALDPRRQLFTTDDFKQLSAYRYKLDDELNGKGWAFLEIASKLFNEKLKRADSLVNRILQKPLDVSVDENISFSNETTYLFAANRQELINRWTKWFKILELQIAYDLRESDSTHQPLKTLVAKHEAEIRQKIKSFQTKEIKAMLEDPSGFDHYVKDVYFNCIAISFDPHTEFFSPQERENFQSQVSTEEYSFGFAVDGTSEGKVVINQLIPGGPAWKTGELNRTDEVLQLQWEGRDPIDVSLLTAEETEAVLNQYNHGNITIKIRKSNGTCRTVTLQKEKIETEEGVVKGYVLAGEKKIGYISLPDFYTTWEDEKGSGCANDVAKEIVKLKKENIEGLILDVRYNGGGSLWEALQMAGIFIDEGPLVGEQDRTGKLAFLKDPNRGTIYDGPMILMVNGQSASASEMVAAALQDYHRALIVGSSTYGKATMQEIFPLDTLTSKHDVQSRDGYIKITLGKLYRVTGQTAQQNGVTPDIILPDAYDGLDYREKFSPDVLAADTINKRAYYKPLAILPSEELSTLSEERIKSNNGFQDIRAIIAQRTAMKKDLRTTIPLELESFEKWKKDREIEENIMDEKENPDSKIFAARNHQQEQQLLQVNDYSKELNKTLLKQIQQDIYIEEVYRIMLDFIKLPKPKTNPI
jgi:carboxyl-terminal processing protease